jgi:hypothetical protein
LEGILVKIIDRDLVVHRLYTRLYTLLKEKGRGVAP